MDEEFDYYSVLGVSRTAGPKEIKKAYRTLAQRYHPDLNNGSKECEAKFKQINTAYQTLKNPESRKEYDSLHPQAGLGGSAQSGPSPQGDGRRTRTESSTRGAGTGSDSGTGSYSSYGNAGWGTYEQYNRGRRDPRGYDIHAQAEIDLESVMTGTVLQVHGTDPRTGQSFRRVVTVPRGVYEGQRIRFEQRGLAQAGGGLPGDLFLTIHIKRNPRYWVENRDLHRIVEISAETALHGGNFPFQTLDGEVILEFPPHLESGKKLRLRGKGLPVFQSSQRGDLYVHIRVRDAERTQGDFYNRTGNWRSDPGYGPGFGRSAEPGTDIHHTITITAAQARKGCITTLELDVLKPSLGQQTFVRESLRVEIPAGIRNAHQLRFDGFGNYGSSESAPRGNLHLTVRVKPELTFGKMVFIAALCWMLYECSI